MSSAESPHRSIWGHLMRTPFQQGWIDAGGVSTRYIQAGPKDAPAIVMLHGTGSSWECFCANIGALSQHFNCYAIDMIGTGFGDKPDKPYEIPVYVQHVHDFMKAVGLERASLIGVSLGAWVTARFAVTHPGMCEKLILLAPSGMIVNRETMARTKGVRGNAINDPSWDNIKTVFNSILYKEEDRIADLVQVRQVMYQQPDMKRAMDNILVLQNADVRERNILTEDEWRSIKAPTLIVLAPDDNPDYYTTGKRACELIPDCTSIEIVGVKHWAQFETPDLFNTTAIKFLSRKT